MRDEAGGGLIRTLDQRRSTLNKSEGCLRTFGGCWLVSGGVVVVVEKEGNKRSCGLHWELVSCVSGSRV